MTDEELKELRDYLKRKQYTDVPAERVIPAIDALVAQLARARQALCMAAEYLVVLLLENKQLQERIVKLESLLREALEHPERTGQLWWSWEEKARALLEKEKQE